MTDRIETRRKRLRFRSWHRGMKELDLLLGGFADRELDAMDEADLDRFEALLEVPEPTIYAWFTGQAVPAPEHDHEISRRLIASRFSLRMS